MGKEKLFRDPVHNYIKIPSSLCDDFIDTYLFQRLRAIEQTSMRCLYPGARHDRFIHSLGTYHLATQMYAVLENDIVSHCDKSIQEQVKNTFYIAALLHDCAHSPFSHTGEIFTKSYCKEIIEERINSFFGKTNFPLDLSKTKKGYPSIHELASAYVGALFFEQKLQDHKVDIEQFARMITGVKNKLNTRKDNDKIKIYNFLISLINGFIIDVDRLDYLLRDTWASGVSNAQVDVVRLLNGIKLNWDTGEIEIKNQSLSSLINAVKARDFIYQWIFPHHKVAYSDYILHDAIQKLISTMAKKYAKKTFEIGRELFSPERFFTPYDIGDDHIYMPTDGDIVYLMKKYTADSDSCDAANQVLTRRKHLDPLWKSVPEFTTLFPPPRKRSILKEFYESFCGDIQNAIAETLPSKRDYLVLQPMAIKKTEYRLKDIKISIDNSSIGLNNINLDHLLSRINHCELYYFFVYVSQDAPKKELIARFKDIYKSCLEDYKNSKYNPT